MYIDGNGDAEGNFTVVALLDDEEVNGSLRMSMQPVGYFQYSPDRVIPVSQLAQEYVLSFKNIQILMSGEKQR